MLIIKILLCLFELQVCEFSQEFVCSLKNFEYKKMLYIGFAFYNIFPPEDVYVNIATKLLWVYYF